MKKFFFAGVLGVFLLTANVASANQGFEGIWQLDGQGNSWVGAHVSNGTIILFAYEPGELSEATAGTINGNVALLTFSNHAAIFGASVTLTSSNTATAVLTKCIPNPGFFCKFPRGSTFHLTKVFD